MYPSDILRNLANCNVQRVDNTGGVVAMYVLTSSCKFVWQYLVPMLSPTCSSPGHYLSGEEGEIR